MQSKISCVHKLEFFGLKWAITDQFHKYLYGKTPTVYTDNNPLTYVLTTAKLGAMGHTWIAGLANYNFNVHYKSGKVMWKHMPSHGLIGQSVIKPSRLIPFKPYLQLPLLDKWLIISRPFHVTLKQSIDYFHPSLIHP